MPGYDRSRIVGMSKDELEEFTCGICLEIFIKPTSTQCCGQTFCFYCINEWLQENDTCPNDRKILAIDQLKPSPKIVTNLLNNMEIKCDFYDKGCEVVVKINDLEKHKECVCAFNPFRKCENCGENKLNHSDKDCIESLVRRLDVLQNDFDQLRQNKSGHQITNELSTNRKVVDQFIGKWELCSTENLDNLLKELGYSGLERSRAKLASKIEFCINGDYFVMKWDGKSTKFKFGEEYEEEVMGQKMKV